MPLKFIAPVAFASVGLATALFVKNVVLLRDAPSNRPDFPIAQFLNYLITRPKFSFSSGKTADFSGLIAPSPQPLISATPTTLKAKESSKASPPQVSATFDWGQIFNFGLTNTPPATPSHNPLPAVPDALEITDSQVNGVINTLIPPGTPVSDLKVTFFDGVISVSGKLVGPVSGSFTAETELKLQEGIPTLKVNQATLGSLPLPSFVLAPLENTANQVIRDALGRGQMVRLKTLEVKNGKIRLAVELPGKVE